MAGDGLDDPPDAGGHPSEAGDDFGFESVGHDVVERRAELVEEDAPRVRRVVRVGLVLVRQQPLNRRVQRHKQAWKKDTIWVRISIWP